MNNERDELAGLLDENTTPEYVDGYGLMMAYSGASDELAEIILAAGYRKPRTITTTDEVDALTNKTIVMTCYGDSVTVYRENVNIPHEFYHFLVQDGSAVTVLYAPDPS